MIKKKKNLYESNRLAFDQAMRVVPNDLVMKVNPDEDKSDTILEMDEPNQEIGSNTLPNEVELKTFLKHLMDGKETKRREVPDLLDDWTEEGIPPLSDSDSSEEETNDEESEEEDIPKMNERAFRVTSVTNDKGN